MPARQSRFVLPAVLAAWAAFVLAAFARSWIPDLSAIKLILRSCFKHSSPDAGLFWMLSHHGGMAFKVLVLVLVMAGMGAVAAAWLSRRGRAGWLASWALGFGAGSLLTLGWGLTGLFFAAPVIVPAILAGGAGLWLALRSGRLGLSAFRDLAPRDAEERWAAGATAVAAAILGALTMAPDTSWDAVVYHLRVPAYFIQEHRVFLIPTHHFTAFPLASEMHYGWLMLWGGLGTMGGGEAPRLLHLSCALAAALAARRIVGGVSRTAGWVAAFALLSCPFTGTIAVRSYNDFVQAALVGVAAASFAGPGSRVAAAVVLGTALGAKTTAVFPLLALGALWFRLSPLPWVAAAVPVLPWLLKNGLMTGNPAAPFLTGLFPAGPETQYQLSAYSASVGSMVFSPRGMLGALSGLFRDPGGETLNELMLVLPLGAFLLPGTRGTGGRRTGILAGLLVAAWLLVTPAIRFLTPAFVPLAALAGFGWERARALLGRGAVWGLGLLMAFNILRLPMEHLKLFDPLPTIIGRETGWDNAGRSLYPSGFYASVARHANEHLPPGARILFMVDIKAHYVWRRTYHDFQYVYPGVYLRWLRGAGLLERFVVKLRQEGVTHIMVVRQRTRDVGRHYEWQGDELAETAVFLATRTRVVAGTPMTELLEMLPAPAPRRDISGYGWMLVTAVENMMLAGGDAAAADFLGRTLKLVPWYSDLKPHLGMALARTGKYAEAEKWLSQAVKERAANSAYAAFVLGQIVYNKGNLKEAEKRWRESARLDPSYSDPHYYLGILFRNTGQEKKAMAEFAEAVRLAPDKPEYDGIRRELEGR
jgi:hypothetical protein